MLKPKRRGGSRGYPVLIRGVLYPSAAEAGRQLGVATRTVCHAIECGRPDGVGMGRNWSQKKPCTINGVAYPSQREGAIAVGLDWRKFGIRCWEARKRKKFKFTWRGFVVKIHDG